MWQAAAAFIGQLVTKEAASKVQEKGKEVISNKTKPPIIEDKSAPVTPRVGPQGSAEVGVLQAMKAFFDGEESDDDKKAKAFANVLLGDADTGAKSIMAENEAASKGGARLSSSISIDKFI